jgi:RNA polymerase sigma factor (sigma-70 family)
VAAARTNGIAHDHRSRVAAVVVRHERALLRVARQASLCHDDALDAYQRALEIFVRRVETVDPATEVAWLKVVVRHEAMAIRRARSESVAGEELDLDAFIPGSDRSVEDQIASGERVRRSAEALRALKPDEAKALMMKAHGLSYEEIGERNGWSYTKVNRAITEGRRRFMRVYEGIESGAECERFAPIVEALAGGAATAAQVLEIRPHLRHCSVCRATVRDLHLSRLRRASLFWPIFIVAEPLGRLGESSPTVEERLQELAGHGAAAPPPAAPDAAVPLPQMFDGGLQLPLELHEAPPAEAVDAGRLGGVRHDISELFHRANASDVATGAQIVLSGGGGRVATVAAVLGLCLSGAGVGTVCVVAGLVPDSAYRFGWVGADKAATQQRHRVDRPPDVGSKRDQLADRSTAAGLTAPSRSGLSLPAPRLATTRSDLHAHRKTRSEVAASAAKREFSFERGRPRATTVEHASKPSRRAYVAESSSSTTSTHLEHATQEFNPAQQEFGP